jgi:hypothetical protein
VVGFSSHKWVGSRAGTSRVTRPGVRWGYMHLSHMSQAWLLCAKNGLDNYTPSFNMEMILMWDLHIQDFCLNLHSVLLHLISLHTLIKPSLGSMLACTQLKLKWNEAYTHKLAAAWMRMVLTFLLAYATDLSHCLWKCVWNSGCRFL